MEQYGKAWPLNHLGNHEGRCKLLMQEIRWKVVNGNSISILSHTWILNLQLDLWPTYFVVSQVEQQPVSSLIIEGPSWCMHRIEQFFVLELAIMIAQIPIHSNLIRGPTGTSQCSLGEIGYCNNL